LALVEQALGSTHPDVATCGSRKSESVGMLDICSR
jgi:hypothetical protein